MHLRWSSNLNKSREKEILQQLKTIEYLERGEKDGNEQLSYTDLHFMLANKRIKVHLIKYVLTQAYVHRFDAIDS